ncbi:hypothetical protein D5086_025287 [Populus alba]|uniref:Uncharacterized protein n=1 Tax=Populus alba TaxID=43335 RepID=A0ACC4B0J6_POPAL
MLESPKDQSRSGRPTKDDRKLPSNPEEVEDLRRDSAANPLIAFTFGELKLITGNFRQDHLLGGGGFGNVYKGLITEDLREGLQPLQVAVKVHDGDNSYQGHREWLEPEDVQNEKPVLTVIHGVADGQLKGKEGSM